MFAGYRNKACGCTRSSLFCDVTQRWLVTLREPSEEPVLQPHAAKAWNLWTHFVLSHPVRNYRSFTRHLKWQQQQQSDNNCNDDGDDDDDDDDNHADGLWTTMWRAHFMEDVYLYTDTLYTHGHCKAKFEFKYWLCDMNAVKAAISGTGWFESCVSRKVNKRLLNVEHQAPIAIVRLLINYWCLVFFLAKPSSSSSSSLFTFIKSKESHIQWDIEIVLTLDYNRI